MRPGASAGAVTVRSGVWWTVRRAACDWRLCAVLRGFHGKKPASVGSSRSPVTWVTSRAAGPHSAEAEPGG